MMIIAIFFLFSSLSLHIITIRYYSLLLTIITIITIVIIIIIMVAMRMML